MSTPSEFLLTSAFGLTLIHRLHKNSSLPACRSDCRALSVFRCLFGLRDSFHSAPDATPSLPHSLPHFSCLSVCLSVCVRARVHHRRSTRDRSGVETHRGLPPSFTACFYSLSQSIEYAEHIRRRGQTLPSIYKQYDILKCVWTWGEKRTGCRKKCRHRSRPPHGNSTCAYVTRACLGIGRLIEREALCSSSNKSNLGTRSKNTDADRDPYSHSHALMRQTLSVPPSLPPSGPSLVSCDGSDGVRYSLGWAGVEWSGVDWPRQMLWPGKNHFSRGRILALAASQPATVHM